MSAGGFREAAGLAEREISMGEDFGRSEGSSIRGSSSRSGGVGMSDSLEGDELSVAILSLSRKPHSEPSSTTASFSTHRPFPFAIRADGIVNEVERGDCSRDSGSHQLCIVGRLERLSIGAMSSLVCKGVYPEPLPIPDEDGELDVDEDRAKSERDVDNDGLKHSGSGIGRSLDDDIRGVLARLVVMLAEDEASGCGGGSCMMMRGQ